MSRFVFITDTHFAASSNVRTDNYFQSLIDKLQFVIEYANSKEATILFSGDFFDKPSVPLFVISTIIRRLSECHHVPYVINGNHDKLFNNPDYSYKTALHLLYTAGSVNIVDNMVIELDDCVITNVLPLKDRNKPQLVLYHGFLNKEVDTVKGYSVYFTDLNTSDQGLVLLGHDHEPYDDVKYNNLTIIRAGSMTRAIRTDSSERTPVLIDILIKDGAVKYKRVNIPCLPSDKIFKPKAAKAVEVVQDYSSLIEQIRQSSSNDMSLINACKMVTTEPVVEYISSVYDDVINVRQNK